jgi:ATP-dependent RNA helicase DeaD
LSGRDVVGQARTGSGKTLAFGIPIVEFVDPRVRAVQALVLTPTRELAVQVAGVLRELGNEKGVEVVTIFGGTGVGPQRLALRKGAQVVVGTPGRVLDLLNQGALWLAKVRLLVLDEADEMLDYGFAPDVERIIARTTPDRQTALFSATVPDWVRTTATKHLNDPVTVAVASTPEDAASIEHVAFDVADTDKIGVLKDLLSQPAEGRRSSFGRTKRGVARLARKLQADGFPVLALQGDMAQGARDRVMAEFRAGGAPILVRPTWRPAASTSRTSSG